MWDPTRASWARRMSRSRIQCILPWWLKDTAYLAVVDYARILTCVLADGALPDNEGRGYVLRRILRRATRYGQQILKCEPGFFVKLVPGALNLLLCYHI